MTVDLTKNSVLNLINQNNDLKKELEKGKLFNYNHSIYFIQTIKNLNNDGNHIKFAIIAHSSLKAHKIFGQKSYMKMKQINLLKGISPHRHLKKFLMSHLTN